MDDFPLFFMWKLRASRGRYVDGGVARRHRHDSKRCHEITPPHSAR